MGEYFEVLGIKEKKILSGFIIPIFSYLQKGSFLKEQWFMVITFLLLLHPEP